MCEVCRGVNVDDYGCIDCFMESVAQSVFESKEDD
jgi:hypothetical protein